MQAEATAIDKILELKLFKQRAQILKLRDLKLNFLFLFIFFKENKIAVF